MLSTTLHRVLVASGLVVATSFMAFSAVYADDVVIGGNVPSTLALTSSLPNTTIDLSPAQTNIEVKVAKVVMGTNNSAGLKVVPTGTFTLARTAPDAAITPVSFTVGMVAGSSGAPASYVASGADMFSTSAPAAITTEHSLYIKYSTAAVYQDPGDYAATITLTASDN
jgi:hypothetical protein